MPTATQLKIEKPSIDWVRQNFQSLHNNCWTLRPILEGLGLIVLVPFFGNKVVDLGKVTSISRTSAQQTLWVITEKMPTYSGRYQTGIKVHSLAEATL